MNKAFYQSKILWVNMVGIIAIVFPPSKELIETIMQPETLIILSNLATILLRLFKTNTNLTLK
jgi:hypothetical protein